MLVCRRFYNIAIAFICESVRLHPRGILRSGHGDIHIFHALLRAKPELGLLCRTLCLATDNSWYRLAERDFAVANDLFPFLGRLKVLKIDGAFGINPHDKEDRGKRHMAAGMMRKASQHLHQLESLIFIGRFLAFDVKDIVECVDFPSLKKLALNSFHECIEDNPPVVDPKVTETPFIISLSPRTDCDIEVWNGAVHHAQYYTNTTKSQHDFATYPMAKRTASLQLFPVLQ